MTFVSINNKVTVTGMQVRTKVSNNLFVASTTLAATAHVDDENFNSYLKIVEVSTLLEPVSSIDGLNFFYTDAANNVNANGSAKEVAYTALNTGKAAPTDDQLTAFNTASGSDGAVGYKDFVMELKAVNGSSSDVALKLTKLDLIYNGLPTSEKAYRAAVFMQKFNGSAYTMISPETLPAATSIFSKSGATNFLANNAVNAIDGKSTVLTPNTSVSVNVAANSTEYYKIVIRLWLEGEDTTCNNETFAALNQNWVLDLAFEFGTETAAASNIGTVALDSSVSGATGTVELSSGKLSNGELPASYQWYNENGVEVEGATSASYTATSTGVYYCKVTTTKGTVYYTDGMKLTVA